MSAKQISASDLETGDRLTDTEGHGYENKFGPDFTDDILVAKSWHGDSWLLKPLCTNGNTATSKFTMSYSEIDEHLESGRYLPKKCEALRTLDAEVLPTDPDDEAYIRFGEIPEDERSTNYADGRKESGVSVYEAETMSVDPDVDAPGMYRPVGPKLLQVLFLIQRDTYLVTGEKAGVGNDGEPVIRDVDVVCELRYDSDANGFVPVDD